MQALSLKGIRSNDITVVLRIASTQILIYTNHFPRERIYVENWLNPCLWQAK